MKRITLELGGKSPTVILDDADLAQAIPLALGAGFMNSGQACIAGTRVLVPRSRLGEVEELAKAAVGEVKTGDPRDPETTVGPMVSQKQWGSRSTLYPYRYRRGHAACRRRGQAGRARRLVRTADAVHQRPAMT